MQQTLFPNEVQPESTENVKIIQKTCRTCAHRERWQCGGSVIQYCGRIHSNRTDNGFKKIKVTNPACILYSEKNVKLSATYTTTKNF